jgi:hypothetical protein
MLRARLGCFVILLCSCGWTAADAISEPNPPVELAQGGVRGRVWETYSEAGKDLHIKATRDGRTAMWRYSGLELDAEPGAVRAEIRELKGAPFLFVHAYSGGASCCWSLLVFDLAQLKPLGEMLPSNGSIVLRRKVAACGLQAEYWLRKDPPGPEDKALRCFDGTIFRKMARKGR